MVTDQHLESNLQSRQHELLGAEDYFIDFDFDSLTRDKKKTWSLTRLSSFLLFDHNTL